MKGFVDLGVFRWLPVIGMACGLAHGQTQRHDLSTIPSSGPLPAEMRDAIVAAQRGDDQTALLRVNTLLSRHANFVPALKLQAMLLEDTGDKAAASADYERVLKLSPNDADALLELGTIELVTGHTDRSISLLSRRLRVAPGDEDGNYYIAQAYHLEGRNDLALVAIRRALTTAPNDTSVLQKYGELLCSSGKNAEAIQWLTKARNANPSLVRINFDLAVASYNNMDLKVAEEDALQEAAQNRNDLDNLVLLSSVQIKLGEWAEAENNLQRVLAVRNTDATSTLDLGHCELELKDYEAAIVSLQRSLQLDPTQVEAYYLLSRAYGALGNTAEAQHEAALHREMMQHLSFVVPKAQARQDNATSDKVRQLLTDGHEAEAIQLFESTDKGPYVTAGTSWMSVGATYLSLGKPEAAERCLHRALQLDPKTHGAYLYLGILALQQNNLSLAEEDFKAELAFDPNQPIVLAELGELRYRQGRWAEASDLLTRSKTAIPAYLYILCDSQFHLGKLQDADLTAETLAAYSKNEPAIMQSLAALLERNGQAELAHRIAPLS